jgi:hypothetical protein
MGEGSSLFLQFLLKGGSLFLHFLGDFASFACDLFC